MAKEKLTDRRVKSLKPAPAGERYEVMDSVVDGLGVRVTGGGQKTFILVARYGGSPHPTRRALGVYDALSVEKARDKARAWRTLIAEGIDPKDHEAERRAVEQRRRDNSFAAVVEDYTRLALIGPDENRPLQRKGHIVARELRKEFVDDFPVSSTKKREGLGGRPIDTIKRHDVLRVIDDAVARGARYQAHNLLGHVRTMFNWALERGAYGLEASPIDKMKAAKVIGKRALRKRTLSDVELNAYWRAAGRLSYPYGPLFRLLALTGQRKSEVAEAKWSEFDLARGLWIIPAERMKADEPHVVLLTSMAVEILKALPRFGSQHAGEYLFSTTFGATPVNGFSKAKSRLDRRMLRTLRALVRSRNEDSAAVTAPDFVIHDVRRTMRTGLSALPVPADVAELIIAHTRPGLRRVYDQFAYLEEKRRAMDLWASRLRDIIQPPPANIIQLQAHRGDALIGAGGS